MDPGGAIGAVSLAIQAVQGVHRYYTRFSAYADDIEAITTRTSRLQIILQDLERSVRKLDLDDDPISAEKWGCIKECLEAVDNLKKHHEKCSQAKGTADGFIKTARNAEKRLAYPFRKETLEDLQRVLDRLLENLQLVLQNLQIDTALKLGKQAEQRDLHTHSQLSQIQYHQTAESKLLLSMDSYLRTRFQKSSKSAMRIEEHLEAHTLQFEKLLSAVQQLSNVQSGTRGTIGDGEIDHHTDPLNVVSRTREVNRARTPTQTDVIPNGLVCHCPKKAPSTRNTFPRWFPIRWSSSSLHRPDCPFYIPSQRLHNVGARFVLSLPQMKYLFETGISWSSSQISPHIICRNIVSRDSPAFTILDLLQSYRGLAQDFNANALILTSRCLLQIFKEKRAGPLDVNQSGRSLLHVACEMIASITRSPCYANSGFDSHLNTFIRSLYSMQIPQNDTDDQGETPLDVYLTQFNQSLDVNDVDIPALDDLESTWSSLLETNSNLHGYKNYLRWFQRESSGLVITGDPLIASIFQQSEEDLLKYLCHKNRTNDHPLLLHLGCIWPQGVRLMLSHGIRADCFDAAGHTALDWLLLHDYMVEDDSTKSALVDLFLQSGVPITESTLAYACDWADASTIIKVAQRLGQHALYDSQSSVWRPRSCIERGKNASQNTCPTLYHRLDRDDVAEELRIHGFALEEINANCTHSCHRYNTGTPLWSNAWKLRLDEQKPLRYVKWLLNNGAKLNNAHPRFKTMPVHLLAESLVQEERHSEILQSQSHSLTEYEAFRSHIFRSTDRDGCTCGCSERGCKIGTVVVNCALLTDAWEAYRESFDPSKSRYENAIIYLLRRTGDIADCPEKGRSIVRALTFARLKLSHTCHIRNYEAALHLNMCEPLAASEVSEIQSIEREELELLDDLLDEFDAKFSKQSGTLLEFLRDYWTRRMDEIMLERNAPRPDELEKIQALGVKIASMGPEEQPPLLQEQPSLRQEWPPSPYTDTFEWFQWAVGEIMEGRCDMNHFFTASWGVEGS